MNSLGKEKNETTNYILPESTLLMLVSALAGKEKYGFFSFGDAMFIG